MHPKHRMPTTRTHPNRNHPLHIGDGLMPFASPAASIDIADGALFHKRLQRCVNIICVFSFYIFVHVFAYHSTLFHRCGGGGSYGLTAFLSTIEWDSIFLYSSQFCYRRTEDRNALTLDVAARHVKLFSDDANDKWLVATSLFRLPSSASQRSLIIRLRISILKMKIYKHMHSRSSAGTQDCGC